MQAFRLQPARLVFQQMAGYQIAGGVGNNNAVVITQPLLTDLPQLLISLLGDLAFYPAIAGPVDTGFGAVQPVFPPVIFAGWSRRPSRSGGENS